MGLVPSSDDRRLKGPTTETRSPDRGETRPSPNDPFELFQRPGPPGATFPEPRLPGRAIGPDEEEAMCGMAFDPWLKRPGGSPDKEMWPAGPGATCGHRRKAWNGPGPPTGKHSPSETSLVAGNFGSCPASWQRRGGRPCLPRTGASRRSSKANSGASGSGPDPSTRKRWEGRPHPERQGRGLGRGPG